MVMAVAKSRVVMMAVVIMMRGKATTAMAMPCVGLRREQHEKTER